MKKYRERMKLIKQGKYGFFTDKEKPLEHNYTAKVLAIARANPGTGLKNIAVCHDDWCAIYKGGYCNCEPDVTIMDNK